LTYSRVFGYAVSGIVSTMGGLVLAGFVFAENVPPPIRMTFGVVLVLMGIYRFAITRMRSAQNERENG